MSRNISTSVPRDANRTPVTFGVSSVDGVTPVPIEVNPANGQLLVSASGGGGGGTQYAEGATTSPATGNVALGRYSSSTPSLSSNQLESLQLDSSGNLRVKLSGDTTATGTITGSGQSVTIATNGQTSVGIQVSGTFSGTILIKGSVDGTSYTPTSAVALSNGAISTTITSSYTGQANAGGLVSFQLTAITWASGNASVTLVASVANSTVMLDNPLPIGTNSIGNVGLNAGSNAIGSITNTSFAATQATASALNMTEVNSSTIATNTTGLNNTVGTTGSTSPSKGILIQGSDGTNARNLYVSSTGTTRTVATIDQTTPGSTNAVYVSNTSVPVSQATASSLNATVVPGTSTGSAVPSVSYPTGFQARSTDITATTSTYNTIGITDLVGKQVVMPYAINQNFQNGTASATGTTSTSLISAVTSNSIYLTSVQIMNTGSTTTYIALQDGSGCLLYTSDAADE